LDRDGREFPVRQRHVSDAQRSGHSLEFRAAVVVNQFNGGAAACSGTFEQAAIGNRDKAGGQWAGG
jgi:hypothetical protein